MWKSGLSIASVLALLLAVPATGQAQDSDTHTPGHHPAEAGAIGEHVERVHAAYVNFDNAVQQLCVSMVDSFTDAASQHHGEQPVADHDRSFFVADCVAQHFAAHNATAGNIHSRIQDQHD